MENKIAYKSPIKSNGFWGFVFVVIVPGILTLCGGNDSNIASLTSDFINLKPIDYTNVNWLNVISQSLGGVLSLVGLLSKNRKPLKWHAPDEN